MQGPLAQHNVLFVVADSLRLDVARSVGTTILPELGTVQQCAASGNFTLPAHVAMFSGFLPLPARGSYAIGGSSYERILRSAGARPGRTDIALEFKGPTLMSAFTASGRRVLGFGGVQFFDPSSPGVRLDRYFDTFQYSGVPTSGIDLLAHGELAGSTPSLHGADPSGIDTTGLTGDLPWMIFVNSAATHFPYACRGNLITSADEKHLDFVATCMRDKEWPYRPHRSLPRWGLERQAQSLQVLLKDLARLLSALALVNLYSTLVLVLADHGEAFGEDGFVGHGVNSPTVLDVPLWCTVV